MTLDGSNLTVRGEGRATEEGGKRTGRRGAAAEEEGQWRRRKGSGEGNAYGRKASGRQTARRKTARRNEVELIFYVRLYFNMIQLML